MPCTKTDDQQVDQQNRRLMAIRTVNRTLSNLRLRQQNLHSFAVPQPVDQLDINLPLMANGNDLAEQIRISVREFQEAEQHLYANEIGGNISDVLEHYDSNNVQQPSYSNSGYIDNGIDISNNGLDILDDNQATNSSTRSSQIDSYEAQSRNTNPYPYDNRNDIENHEISQKHNITSTSANSLTDQIKPIFPGTSGIAKTTDPTDRRQNLPNKENDTTSPIRNKLVSRSSTNDLEDDAKVLKNLLDESRRLDKLSIQHVVPTYCNHKQAGVIENYLHGGSLFKGFQKSRKESYEVQVKIQHVDHENSYLCGYLCINHLTKTHPSLTTFFDGEIISEDYPFLTRRWQATEEIDRAHWSRFEGFNEKWVKSFNSDSFDYKGLRNSDQIYMRWKEHFLVPDHRIKHVEGASYEGFYYVCYSKPTASIKGFYFHSNSENFESFQSLNLELDHQGSTQIYQFR